MKALHRTPETSKPPAQADAFWRQLALGVFAGPMLLVLAGVASRLGWLDGLMPWVAIFLAIWAIVFVTLRTRRAAFILGLAIGLVVGFILLKVLLGI